MSARSLKIKRVAETKLSDEPFPLGGEVPAVAEWFELDPDATDADILAEFAGRSCYESWDKPNPKTATNKGYNAHVLEVQHLTLFGHATVTYRIEGVSRSLTHELVRHRFPTFSQLSQRYVKLDDELPYVVPPLMRGDEFCETELAELADEVMTTYSELISYLEQKHGTKPAMRKKIREASRAILPNMTETKIVVTANLRAWRDMFEQRLPPTADAEIRELAHALLADLKQYAPNSFQDLPDVELVSA